METHYIVITLILTKAANTTISQFPHVIYIY